MAILEVSDLKQYFYLHPTFLGKLVGGEKPRIIKAVDVFQCLVNNHFRTVTREFFRFGTISTQGWIDFKKVVVGNIVIETMNMGIDR